MFVEHGYLLEVKSSHRSMLLTGVRDGAIASLKLKHVDIAKGRLVQDARARAPKSFRPSRPEAARISALGTDIEDGRRWPMACLNP
jgi:hypothetical protein